MRNDGGWLVTAAAVLFGVAGAVQARQDAGQQPQPEEPPAAAEAGGRVAPEAQALLDRVHAFYSKLPGVQVTAEIAERENKEAETEDVTKLTILASDPNKIAARTDGAAQIGYQLVSDGQTVHQFIGMPFNKYSESPAPDSYEGLLELSLFGESPDAAALATNPPALVLALMSEKGLDAVLAGAGEVTYGGTEDIGGAKYHRVRIGGDQAGMFPTPNLDLWVMDGEKPWIGRVSPDLSPMVAKMKEMGVNEAFLPYLEIRFSGWQEQNEAAPVAFAFSAPEGAEKVDSLLEAMMARGAEEAEDPGAALLGAPAPAFKVDLLGGGAADLSAHKGKDIVILDFWATWCPPCVKGLPIVSQVSEKYKDRNVVFYAVNVQEEQDTIREFLKKRSLESVKVALDPNGQISQQYGVSGIPQTVIIDKQGTVQAVHVGLLPDMEEQLTKELETLLKGEPLVKPAEPAAGDGGEH